jgi:queuine tRNA-ribosyltransferase
MGVGTPTDILLAVQRGVDMFDCVMPTRNARNAQVFTQGRPLKLRNAKFRVDQEPIERECPCFTCRSGFTRSYLRHLFMVEEITAYTLATIHNLTHYQDFMARLRAAIREGSFDRFAADFLARHPVQSRDTPVGETP